MVKMNSWGSWEKRVFEKKKERLYKMKPSL